MEKGTVQHTDRHSAAGSICTQSPFPHLSGGVRVLPYPTRIVLICGINVITSNATKKVSIKGRAFFAI